MRHLGTMSKIFSVNEASPDWTNPNSTLDIDLTSKYDSRLCWKAASWERMEVSKMKNFWQLLSIVVCTAIAEVPGLPIVLFEFKTAREYNQWWFVCFTLLHIVALWFKSLSSHWKCRRRAPEDQSWVAEICRNCMTPHTRLKQKSEQATVGVRKLQHFLCKDPTAYGATGQNWIPFLSAVHWLNALCHSKHCCTVVYRPCF